MPTYSYLLDTNVISATVRAGHPELLDWLERHSERLYLSTITIAEIEAGIAKLARTGATRRASAISEWLDAVVILYGSRVLPFDISAARKFGGLFDLARSKGRAAGFADVAIAAIASARRLILLTRNVRDFSVFEIELRDPFESVPP